MTHSSLTPTGQLARALLAAGYTHPAQLGALLVPEGTYDARSKAGRRLLDAEHVPDLDRLSTLARETGRTIVIAPHGVILT